MRATCLLKIAFCLCHAASGHYLWLKEDVRNVAAITFSDPPGVPSAITLLEMIANKVSLFSHDAQGQKNVTLNISDPGIFGWFHSELVGHIRAVPPFSLRLSATYGIFRGSLLRYWSSADVVTEPNDWFKIQEWAPREGLEITIRDPWMNHSVSLTEKISRALVADRADECKPHEGPLQDGAACVVAVIRFNGELVDTPVSVETFAADGKKLSETEAQSGVVIIKVPLQKGASSTAAWARVGYHENVPGKYQGKDYTYVDHWATTFARIQRAQNDVVMV